MKGLNNFVDKVALRDEKGEPVSMWYNEDIRPIPPHRRTWTSWTYFSYQSGVGIIIVTWSTGASLLGLGLSWLGMMCVRATIGSLWPSFYNLRNTFPDSVPMTTGDFVAWFIFTLLCLGGVMVKPENFHWPSVATASVNLITSLALVGWFAHRAGGPGVLFKNTESLTGVEPARGSEFGWAFIHALTTVISSQATGILGFADWGRYAKRPGCQRYPQGLGMALSDMISVLITVSGSSIAGGTMQPWVLSNTSSKFLAVMGSYAIFLAPLTGILHCEYYLVRRQRLSLQDMFLPNSSSSYWYFHGISLRAVVSFCAGFFVFLPGYIHNITPSIEVGKAWSRLFYMCYPLGYFGTGAIHFAISKLFPPQDLGKVDEYDIFHTFAPGEKLPGGIIMGVSPGDTEAGESGQFVVPTKETSDKEDTER
ncbi:hypothetical protein G7Z17_g511 [Cylindrodendrum hubeiense]|uniref:Uncharacterized protein n=1 Tax=Cylindrodendrum hubeiense TaxID=595255 RepID=A0A9P5HN46_9HYPO|nr:hypothetical protein G7Z17_g511 [Cylindrodendrum hubeiense]